MHLGDSLEVLRGSFLEAQALGYGRVLGNNKHHKNSETLKRGFNHNHERITRNTQRETSMGRYGDYTYFQLKIWTVMQI